MLEGDPAARRRRSCSPDRYLPYLPRNRRFRSSRQAASLIIWGKKWSSVGRIPHRIPRYIYHRTEPSGWWRIAFRDEATSCQRRSWFICRGKNKPDTPGNIHGIQSDLRMDPGSYTVYTVSIPETKDQFNDTTTYGTVSIIYKKPFITAEISPSSISQGRPFTVSGIAEGIRLMFRSGSSVRTLFQVSCSRQL